MPSPLPRRKRTAKKGTQSQTQNFKPALKALNSLVGELENSESPEDDDITSEIHGQKSSSASPNVTSHSRGRNTEKSTRNQTISPNSFFRTNGLFEEFGSDSESDDNEEDSLEERPETRTLTEIERLEEAQTVLEDRIKHVKELLLRRDRTRNQRLQGQRTLVRLEAKLEMLDQRLELERAGKNRWTFVKRAVRKPKVGFHSSELMNRKVPLGVLAGSLDTERSLAGAVLEAMEDKSKDVKLADNPPPNPKKMFKTKELQDFHLSLEENAEAESSKDGWHKNNSSEELEGSVIRDDANDRKEIGKGWLRISDRPKDFIKKIDVSETHQSKEAWVTINEKGHQIFARKVLRSHLNGSGPSLSRSLDGRVSAHAPSGKFNFNGRRASSSLTEKRHRDSNEKRVGRISSSRSQRPQVVKMESILGTTSFLPPIPKSEAKKRPKQEQVEQLKDENDEEQRKERLILIPNRKRVAKRRVEMYLKQLDFVRSHGLDQKEVLKNVSSAIQEYCDGEEELAEHQAQSTPRNTLYLIGALSRNHLRPPTAPTKC